MQHLIIDPRARALRVVLPIIVFFVIVLFTLPSFSAMFISDDILCLRSAAKQSSWVEIFKTDGFGYFRPLKSLLFYVTAKFSPYPFWDDHNLSSVPAGFLLASHVFTLLCYLLACVGVYKLCQKLVPLSSKSLSALFPAFVLFGWGLSGSNLSTSAWLTAANLSVCAFFLCMAVLSHLRWLDLGDKVSAVWQSWLMLTYSALAMLSYESGVVVVFLVPLAHFVFNGSINRKVIFQGFLLVLVLLVFLLVRHLAGSHFSTMSKGWFPGTTKWELFLASPWFYFIQARVWFWPAGHTQLFSSFQWGVTATIWEIAACWVFLLAMVSSFFCLLKRMPLTAFGLGWFLLALFPTSNMLPLFSGPFPDYYSFLPAIGLSIAGVAFFYELWPVFSEKLWFKLLFLAYFCCRVMAAVEYFKLASYWVDPARFTEHSRANYRTSWQLDVNLAQLHSIRGEWIGVEAAAIRLLNDSPYKFDAYFWSAVFAQQRGDTIQEAALLRKALLLDEPLKQPVLMSRMGNRLIYLNYRKGLVTYDPAAAFALTTFLKDVTDNTKEHPWLIYVRCLMFFDQGDTVQANLLLDRALMKYPTFDMFLLLAAELKAGTFLPQHGEDLFYPKLIGEKSVIVDHSNE